MGLWADDGGQVISEYAIIISIAAVLAIGAMVLIGGKLVPIFEKIADSLSE